MTVTNGPARRTAPAPLFYTRPVVINEREHAAAGIRETVDFGFARRATLIPLAFEEIFPAAASYPLVVVAKPQPAILAAVGFDDGLNRFVDKEGRWAPGTHIPAYVRRWPYITARVDEDGRLVLCVDETMLDPAPNDERRFFNDGTRASTLDRAMEFCAAFQRGAERAERFVGALGERDLLVERVFETRFSKGAPREVSVLRGVSLVEEERFNALPDEVWLSWRRDGWVSAVHALLISQARWSALGALV